MKLNRWMFVVSAGLAAAGCAGSEDLEEPPGGLEIADEDYVKGEGGKGDASVEAVFLDFTFDGTLVTTSTWGVERQIEDQLLYTVGQLNGDRSVGRLDRLRLSNVRTSRTSDGKTQVDYSAKLLVAWGRKNAVPTTYELVLPIDVSYQGQRDFTERHKDSCVDWSAHDVDSGSMWYYYRPRASRCSLSDDEVVRIAANVAVSDVTTTGKYPEYHKLYEDGVLRIVAVFGKYEDGATSGDAGISAYNRFVSSTNSMLADRAPVVTPANVPANPGVAHPDISWTADLGDGKSVEITALLVDNVRTAGAAFDRRYEQLSSNADLISYAGHAGLGSNIQALARKGRWVQGQYTIVFMNGCDTYAYVDSALNDAHARVNPDDPMGTKYVDIVTNAMPSYFSDMSQATVAFVKGLMAHDAPQTFEQIFRGVSSAQVVLVSGEHDNVYVPGYGGGGGIDEDWDGMTASGAVSQREDDHYETPKLPAGKYRFEMTGTGDADIYVKIGAKPSASNWDCRPYKAGSSEVCEVELASPAQIFVMVNGWASQSTYDLVARALEQQPDNGSTSTTYEATEVVAIPDNDRTGIESVIDVPDTGRIKELSISLDISHTYRGDLVVTLEHLGRTATISNGQGGSDDDLILDAHELTTFAGQELAGPWLLRVVDRAAQDVGTLNTWSLHVTQ